MLAKLAALITPKNRRSTPDANVLRGEPPPSIAVFSEHFKRYGLADLLHYESFDPETQLYYNSLNAAFINPKERPKSYGFILEIPPSPGADEEMAKILLGMFNQHYPTGSTIQCCLYASPEIAGMCQAWVGARQSGSIYERMAQRRADYLLKGTRRSLFKDSAAYLVRDYRCTFALMMPGNPDDSDISDALSLRDSLMGVLRAAGFPARVVAPPDLLALVDELVSPAREGDFKYLKPHYDEHVPLREQAVSREVNLQMKEDGLQYFGQFGHN